MKCVDIMNRIGIMKLAGVTNLINTMKLTKITTSYKTTSLRNIMNFDEIMTQIAEVSEIPLKKKG